MNLVIVESPAKAKTIEKYLGSDYKVIASFGHVRDLPTKEIGVDTENNFLPTYVIGSKAKKVVSDIKRLYDNAEMTYLATDLDREGEAISWHVKEALKPKKADLENIKRITFSEITKEAVSGAIKNPRDLDMNLVDAQQARRILDRLVGYKLSPLLWKKVRRGLSAGRVQSVAVRLVSEREREIEAFNPEEFWLVGVWLSKENGGDEFLANLIEVSGKSIKKMDVGTKEEADKIINGLDGAKYAVLAVEKKESIRRPSAPFTTSTLQMEASRKMGYSAKKTMMLAQRLYEDGHITYMRTDSTNLSSGATGAIKKMITSEYGEKYLAEGLRNYQTKTKHAQEAHEAIRPTHFEKRGVGEDPQQAKLYELIWKRAVASQMRDAIFDVLEVKIGADTKEEHKFLAKGESLKFDGFMKVYIEGRDDEVESDEGMIPMMENGEKLKYLRTKSDQKFTEPPKRYTEAMLVKKLESLGIGRPSTYAPTMSTIQDRGYVKLDNKRFFPEEIGLIVNDLLVKNFPDVVDYQFTAEMEDNLDEIAEGHKNWVTVLGDFYKPFIANLDQKYKDISRDDVMPEEKTDEKCPECGSDLVIKLGRFGKFVACSSYPKCKFSKPIVKDNQEFVEEGGKKEDVEEMEEEKCEKCGGKMMLKEGRFGKFLACENYPKCKFTKTLLLPTGIKCPDCGEGELVERKTRKGRTFWGCSKYPSCKYATWDNPVKAEEDKE